MTKQVRNQMVVQLHSGEMLDLQGWSVLYPLPRRRRFVGPKALFESDDGQRLVIKDEVLEGTPWGPLRTTVFYDARAPHAVEWLRLQPKGRRTIKKYFSSSW